MLAIIRQSVRADLERRGLPREKVLATVEYAKENESFGLTTMRGRHVRVSGATLRFRFRGKSGLEHAVELTDERLARIVRKCQELPGYELFHYVNEGGEVCRVDSADVNAYLREITSSDFAAKDFRAWAGTILAARVGNRLATCPKYYMHPAILEGFSSGASGVISCGRVCSTGALFFAAGWIAA